MANDDSPVPSFNLFLDTEQLRELDMHTKALAIRMDEALKPLREIDFYVLHESLSGWTEQAAEAMRALAGIGRTAQLFGDREIPVAYSGDADHSFRFHADHPFRADADHIGAKRRWLVS